MPPNETQSLLMDIKSNLAVIDTKVEGIRTDLTRYQDLMGEHLDEHRGNGKPGINSRLRSVEDFVQDAKERKKADSRTVREQVIKHGIDVLRMMIVLVAGYFLAGGFR